MDLVWLWNQNTTTAANWSKIKEEIPNFEAIPSKYHIYLIVLYSVTAIFSFFGNLATLIVLKYSEKTSKNLTKYLINLSCSDMMMASFSIPFTYTMFMYGQWFFEPIFCPFVLAIQFYSAFVSIYTLVAIGIDRYIAVKNPIQSKMAINHFTKFVILGIWIVGFLLAQITFRVSEAFKIQVNNETIYVCQESLTEDQSKTYVLTIFVITFLIPCSIIVFVYSWIAVLIFQRNTSKLTVAQQQKFQIYKTLLIVVQSFIFCWLPLHSFNLLVTLFPTRFRHFDNDKELLRYAIIGFAFHWLAMSHSFVNPLIYSFMSQSFRNDFKNLFVKRISSKSHRHWQSSVYYNSSRSFVTQLSEN